MRGGQRLASESYSIGITGHRQLPRGRISALAAKIQSFYRDETTRCGTENLTVLSSLAEGADMLCAKLALDAGLKLVVPLPMDMSEYRKVFSGPAIQEFNSLLSMAHQVFVAPPEEPIPPDPQPGFFYRQAGIYIVKNCDILLAVWNGEEIDTPDGAGTWETVKLAQALCKEIHPLWV